MRRINVVYCSSSVIVGFSCFRRNSQKHKTVHQDKNLKPTPTFLKNIAARVDGESRMCVMKSQCVAPVGCQNKCRKIQHASHNRCYTKYFLYGYTYVKSKVEIPIRLSAFRKKGYYFKKKLYTVSDRRR